MSSVHEKSVKGFNQSNVEAYNKGRPSYNDETITQVLHIINSIHSNLNTINKPSFIELGSGTGKFTESLFRHPHNIAVDSYLACEPSEAFLQSLKDLHLGVNTSCSSANHIPTKDSTVSAVLVAQAFHWMATIETLVEIYRVLQSKCPLIMIWNSLDKSVEWLYELELQVLSRYYYSDDIPRFISGKWIKCFQTEVGRTLFSPLSHWESKSEIYATEDQVLDRVLSVSVIASLDEEEKSKVRDEVLRIVREHPSVKRTDDGLIILNYSHQISWTTKE